MPHSHAVSDHTEAGAPGKEIEVTPEMIEAGASAWALLYRAMEAARLGHHVPLVPLRKPPKAIDAYLLAHIEQAWRTDSRKLS
jgi:hypothetical protein